MTGDIPVEYDHDVQWVLNTHDIPMKSIEIAISLGHVPLGTYAAKALQCLDWYCYRPRAPPSPS